MCAFPPLTVLLMTYAEQILKKNLYFIVSSTAVVGKNSALNQVSSDTASFTPAGFGRIGHFRHCWLVWEHVQWVKLGRLRLTLVL